MAEYPRGWTCELVLVRLERYLIYTLPWGEALAVADHIEACVSCAQHLALVSQHQGAGGRGR